MLVCSENPELGYYRVQDFVEGVVFEAVDIDALDGIPFVQVPEHVHCS